MSNNRDNKLAVSIDIDNYLGHDCDHDNYAIGFMFVSDSGTRGEAHLRIGFFCRGWIGGGPVVAIRAHVWPGEYLC